MKKLALLLFICCITIVSNAQCNLPAPTANSIEICENSIMQPLTASTTETVIQWRWFDIGLVQVYSGTSSQFSLPALPPGTYTYYVSYTAIDPITLEECESPRTTVTVVINPLPTVTINETKTVLCYDQGPEIIEHIATSANGSGTATWTVNGASTGITNSGIFDPTFTGQVTGTYEIGLSYTDAKGCTNSASKMIYVQYSAPPTTTNHLSMIIANITPSITATGGVGATIQWYQNVTGGTAVATGSPWLTGDPGNLEIAYPGKNYYASQTIRGCESQRTAANVLVFECPVPKPNVVQPTAICNYDEIPTLTATLGSPWGTGSRPSATIPETFKFYDANGVFITSNTTGLYLPTIDTAGVYMFYVSEYNENIIPMACESPLTPITVVVNQTPEIQIINPNATICNNAPYVIETSCNISSNVNYNWTGPNGFTSTQKDISFNSAQLTDEGTYSVTATINGCSSTEVSSTITVNQNCLCIDPIAPIITSSDSDNMICPNGTVNLQSNSQINTTLFDFSWYTNSVDPSNLVKGPSTTDMDLDNFTVSHSDLSGATTYYLLVRDKSNPTNTECWDTTSIILTPAVNPTYTIAGGGTICYGSTAPGVIINFTGGVQPYSITWVQTGTSTRNGSPVAINASSYIIPSSTLAAGTYSYALSAISDRYCTGTPSAALMSDITINAKPVATAATTTPIICEGSSIVLQGTSNPSIGATYAWTGPNGYTSTLQNPTIVSATRFESGIYSLTVTVNGCTSISANVNVTVNAIPTITAMSNSPICEGTTLNLSAISSITSGATYAWTGPGSYTVTTQNPTISSATTARSGAYNVTVTVGGCSSTGATTVVTVNARPSAPTVNNPSYCVNSAASPLTAIGSNLIWYTAATGGTGSSIAPTPLTSTLGSYNYWVSQTVNGCESPKAPIIVTINSSLSPTITASPSNTVCQGTPINLSVSGAVFTSTTWSGTAAAQINMTSIATPTFSASAPAGTYITTVNVEDANGCSGSSNITLTVNPKPLTPNVQDFSSNITSGVTSITNSTIPYSNCTLHWYSDAELTNEIGTGSTLSITNAIIAYRELFLAQVNTEGCKSDAAIQTLCNIPNPSASLASIHYRISETAPEITCLSTLGNDEEYMWIMNNDTLYQSNAVTPTYSEYGNYSIQLFIHNTVSGCKSAPTIIPVTIDPCLATPTLLSDSAFTIYVNNTIPTFISDSENTVWFDSHNNIISSGSHFTPSISRVGTYTFYMQNIVNSCVSPQRSVTVEILSYSVSGLVYTDINKNGLLDYADMALPNQKIYISETNEYISTDASGMYRWNTSNPGIYTIQLINTYPNQRISSDSILYFSVNISTPMISNANFSMERIILYDIYAREYNTSRTAVGRAYSNNYAIQNIGDKAYNLLCTITYDPTKEQIGTFNYPIISHINGVLEFMIDSIEVNQTIFIPQTYYIKPDFNLSNTYITHKFNVSTSITELNETNNSDSITMLIRNSLDPNDKSVYPSHLDKGYVLFNSKLQYRIRFQNKGNGEAWDIFIKDTINQNLDISSFNVVSSSHPMHYVIQNNIVTFYFDNIMLPYEAQDSAGSNGYVIYEINPKPGLLENTEVFNTAHIYFDFNPAVVTNTTQSTYVSVLPKGDDIENEIKNSVNNTMYIAPNPARDYTYIYCNNGLSTITITDNTGKIITEFTSIESIIPIHVQNYKPGTYICTITTKDKKYSKQLIVK